MYTFQVFLLSIQAPCEGPCYCQPGPVVLVLRTHQGRHCFLSEFTGFLLDSPPSSSSMHRKMTKWHSILNTLYCHLLVVVVTTIQICNGNKVDGTLVLSCLISPGRLPWIYFRWNREGGPTRKKLHSHYSAAHPARALTCLIPQSLTSDSPSSAGLWLQILLTNDVFPESPGPCQVQGP